ncbi:RING finger domain-containing protein [Akanthomyces lecanii RCEF 1005]|uniref:RING finger domain-containing protein n=1 Tax=Akanthomyces lecanii RCEF 1005 TaxID=1081108 RepID=A0A168JHB5_CORDF|nr:RING finger domain-containing protein [Akanthomyces lecanii RCEF 1005]
MSGAAPLHGGDAPPPYSETDIYSNSGAGAVPSAPPTLADDVTSRMSSNEEIIYTPPDTPRTTNSRSVITGIPQAGADLYFETRPPPPPGVIPPSTLVHALHLETQSLPDDFPFPSDWEKRDINAQDWATFINFLLPDHTTRGNDVILERKLRAEAESEAGDSVSSGRSQAELQRHMMRTAGPEALQDEAQRQANAMATVHEWNEGFFTPRGITISIAASEDDEVDYGATARDGEEQPAPGSGWWPNASSFRIDAGGIAYGKKFVMDGRGIRLGSLIMDANGIRTAGHDGDAPGILQDAGAGPSSRSVPDAEPTRGRAQASDNMTGKGKGTARDRSASSVSSASSASSSSSVSSLDSLPDYDEVREQQLPAYLNILRDWTSKPSHLRTNTDVVWLKNELSLAKFHTANPTTDKRELKAQIKMLLKQWKQIQREQRKTQRGTRSARKKQRRQEKRERKQWRRDLKRSQRDVRRAEKEARRHGGHMPPVPFVPPLPHGRSMPAVPAGPAVPAMPAMPSMPAMPHGMHCPPSMRLHNHHPHQRHHEHGVGGRGGWSHHGRGGFGRGGFGRAGFPGAWPPRNRHGPPGCRSDSDRQGDAPPVPNPALAAKYTAAQGIEDAIRKQQEKADNMFEGPGKDAIQSAIASMMQSLESLRMDADEEYARHVVGSHVTPERSVITKGVYWTTSKDREWTASA